MANYTVVNSKFEPFSFERYIQPYAIIDKEYRDIQNQYSELEQNAAVWERILDQEKDAALYNLYQDYMGGIEEQALSLEKNGLTSDSRNALLKMKKLYKQDILPIELGYAKKETDIKTQDDIRKQLGNNVEFSRDARETPVSAYIKGTPSYDFANLNSIYNESLQGFQNISKNYISYDERTAFNGAYYNLVQQQGIRPDIAIKQLLKDPRYSRIAEFYESSLVKNKAVAGNTPYNDISRDRIDNTIIQGMIAGLGYDEDWKLHQNWMLQDALRNPPKVDENVESQELFLPVLTVGAQGETSEEAKILEGIRQGGPFSVSTNTIDNLLNNEFYPAEKKLNDFLATLPDWRISLLEKYWDIEERRARGENVEDIPMNEKLAHSFYQTYKHHRSIMLYKKKKVEEELEKLLKLEEQYDYLGKDRYSRLERARKLLDRQEKEQVIYIPLNAKSSQYNDIMKGIQKQLLAYTRDDIKGGNVGIKNSEGEAITDYKEFINIVNSMTDGALKITSDPRNPGLRVTVNGEDYTIEGNRAINDYAKDLKVVNDFLRDFSKEAVKQNNIITPETYREIMQKGIDKTTLKSLNYKRVEGTDYDGAVLYCPEYDEYIKILSDSEGMVATNSLSQEIEGRGQNRNQYFQKMAKAGLINSPLLFSQNYGG